MNNTTDIIVEWWEGRYALGWRGWLAARLLRPVVYEVFHDIMMYGTHIRKDGKRVDPETYSPNL